MKLIARHPILIGRNPNLHGIRPHLHGHIANLNPKNQDFMEHYASANGLNIPAKHEFRKAARVSLFDLIRYTPMNIRENRNHGCRLYFYGTEYFKRPGKRGLRIFAYRSGCSKRTYSTQIGFVDWRRGLKSTIWVWCSCDYFKFNVEYVLAQLGSSELVFSWNQPPNVRNPKRIPHACKHILLCVDDALKRAKSFAKVDQETELQDVDIEKIREDKEFKPEKLQDEKRFRELQKPKRPVFQPFTKEPEIQETKPDWGAPKPEESKL